ncbi:hypothetical protein AB0F72_21000 [Actinoplanes sp. NPDC023936]|uniref:hypothetical protein n=1 Tax=Actinoplanes sp. NPDC023936 TaxID=3154910 RepID=UPI0033E17DFB
MLTGLFQKERRMWICGNCGETNDGVPDVCDTCGRPARSTEPTRWDALPPLPARWEPRNAPGFRDEPPAPRNAPPQVAAARPWSVTPKTSPGSVTPKETSPGSVTPKKAGPGERPRPPVAPKRTDPGERSWPPPAEPQAAWIPEPAGVPARTPHRRVLPRRVLPRRVLPAVPIVVLIAALAAAAILGGPRLLASTGDGAPTRAEQATVQNPPALERTRQPAKLVTVEADVTHPRAAAVAAMLETYFTGINAKDYARVAAVLDPAGELDPGDPAQMTRFTDGTATAKDSAVVLRDLTDLGAGRLGADVTFRSEQEAGDGPAGRVDETCTDWRVSYTISTGGGYRILRGEATSEKC